MAGPDAARYQLVIQLPSGTIQDYDAMIELEDMLIAELSGSADVDGHDIGEGRMNVFIFTSDPNRTLREAIQVIRSHGFFERGRAAYREVDGNDFTILWPEDATSEKFTV